MTIAPAVDFREKKNRAGIRQFCLPGWRVGPGRGGISVPDGPLGLSHASALPFRGLLVVGGSLHIADQPLLFAQLLETPDHLLHGLAGTHLDF